MFFTPVKILAPAALILLAGAVHAEQVEITTQTDLDGVTNSYCFDIKGGQDNADPADGLQAHTCYSYTGTLGTDQLFETDRFASNELYMPSFDVCATAADMTAGATLTLTTCDQSDAQSFAFTSTGTISPTAAPELCVGVGDETKFGRSKTHQIKTLTLQTCSTEDAETQQWRTRTEDD